ncbi:uncharacterized protein BP01DRAFT_197300 [Aspergillus saccharolyticus JOP 1030-1]|uniref:Uncharacterized protein n=1 Tax=Aspergillus saccharolyticus JOP 1030-1 TaxID=1450539 RepID=A0A318ZM77_9EURO|nr:hypothetical protein BP01DRAFT_197300 [Aspergillus saccharolyticus JOP 1030-1]PYH47775.1 hypothetical protein BP01DRAFT_197300 [Aspergillus saccharolyticus JOP 1030-1]
MPYSLSNDHPDNASQTPDSGSTTSQASEELTAELDYYRGLLERIMSIVRSGDQARVAHLISIIRDNPSDSDIYTQLEIEPPINDSDEEEDKEEDDEESEEQNN